MAADKLVDSSQLDGALIATADAIRAYNSEASSVKKTWNDDTGFSSIIAHMTDQASGTAATASTMLNGKVAYVNGTKITGNIATKTSSDLTATNDMVYVPAGYYASQASKSVGTGSVTVGEPTINSSTGLVTATATVTAGYLDSQTKSNTLQLTAKGAATYNTSTEDQTIAAGQYLTGAQTIRQVKTVNIEAGNIKYGVNVKVGDAGNSNRIANVTGTFTKANTVSSGQSAASASQILDGYSAWVDGAEVQGAIQTQTISQGTTTVSGTTATRGTASWDTGFIEQGSISAATFASSATSGKTYIDISNTTSAPVLVSGNYLYINKGYTDDLKISLAKLVPDAADVGVATTSGSMLNGFTAYNNNGQIVTGTIQDLQSSDISVNASTNVITIPVEKYTTGTAITTSMSSGAYHATASISTQGKVTPKVTLDATATSSYGFTTTKPSGTSGTNYLTLDPNADIATDGKVTPKAYIDTAGHVAANSTGTAGTIITVNPTINAGTNYYVPIVGVTLGGGGLTTATNTNTVGTAPVVTIASSGTFKSASTYGVTTTKPSGTDGTNYLTIDGTGTPTNGKATSTVNVTRAAVTYTNNAGAISANSGVSGLDSTSTGNITKEVTITPTVTDNFAPLYIPVVSITSSSFSGGGLTNTTNYTGTPTVTLASGIDSNMTNITISDKDETNYPYYFKVTGSTAKMTGTTKVTRAELTFSNTAGAIAANNGTQALASGTSSPSVTVNAASGSKYVGLKQATMTVAGSNVVSPSISKADCITWSDTNNGISVTGGGTASVTATATTNAAGYAPASTQLGSAALNAPSKTTTKYLTKITVPKAQAFEVATAANTAADAKVLTVSNGAYRTVTATNAANGTVNLTNNGTATVTSGSATAGSLTVSAYNSSGTAENNKAIVTNGKWVATTASAATTYYGRVTVPAGTITSGTGKITSVNVAYNSTNENFDVTGSATVSAPTVGTAGFVSSSVGTKNTKSGGATVAATLPVIGLLTNISGTPTVTPVISKQAISISGVTDAANGDATTTAPSSGVYVAVKSAESLTALGGDVYVVSSGYGTSSNCNIEYSEAYAGANASSMTYVPIKTATPSFATTAATGGATATGTGADLQTADQGTGITIQAKYSVNAVAVKYNAACSGWVTAANGATAVTLASRGATNGTLYYLKSVTVPKAKTFTVTTTANTAADTKALAVTNNAYRITNVTNAANGTTNVTNSGTTTVTSGSATAGSLTVSAYNSSGTAENNKSIVTNGKWVATSVSAAGTFYGRVTVGAGTVKATVSSNTGGSASMAATGFTASSSATSYYVTLSTTAGSVKAKAAGDTAGYVTSSTTNETAATSVAVSGNGNKLYIPAGSVTTSLTADGMSIYFNSGTSSDKNVTLTPKYTNTAGYKAAVTTATNNGGTAYYKIKTASPTFSAAPTGGSTATGTNCSISNTTNNSGVSVQTKYSINAVAINYAAAATGWIDKAASAATGSNTTAKSATNGTAYYINGVTMTTPSSGTRTFTVTAPSEGTNHTYTFTQDANGRTSIKVDTILTMQWNDDKQALDFIYT